jgi:DNA-binding NarL/FixJ family response regulator
MKRRKRVVIIDPSKIYRRTLKEIIQTYEVGIEVTATAAFDRIADSLRHAPPSAAIVDIATPHDNGLRLIEKIKTASPNTRIVVLTTHDSAEHKRAALARGADFFLSKVSSGGLRLMETIRFAIRPLPDDNATGLAAPR